MLMLRSRDIFQSYWLWKIHGSGYICILNHVQWMIHKSGWSVSVCGSLIVYRGHDFIFGMLINKIKSKL